MQTHHLISLILKLSKKKNSLFFCFLNFFSNQKLVMRVVYWHANFDWRSITLEMFYIRAFTDIIMFGRCTSCDLTDWQSI